jgi:NAD(P)-dependent dehydrogenase (short-subunit alcohol dehydrogenase family)
MARSALITGASRGIGRGVAVALARNGFDLALAARHLEGLEDTAAAAAEVGEGRTEPIAVDLSRTDECFRLAATASEVLGRAPDVFVHCAGIAPHGPIGQLSLTDWQETQQINVTSAFILASELGPLMAAAGWGRFVTIGSLYSRLGEKNMACYAASKHAILGLTRVLAAEYATKGVTANTLTPGYVDTDMVRDGAEFVASKAGLTPAEVVQRFLRVQPVGRLITIEEVGALVAFLCSDDAAPITGQAIGIDGGAYQS